MGFYSSFLHFPSKLAAEQKKKQILQKSLCNRSFNKRILKIKVNDAVHIAQAEIAVTLLKCALLRLIHQVNLL